MTEQKRTDQPIDWRKATFEGATREAMRRWAALPLEEILAAQEEMADLAEALGHSNDRPGTPALQPGSTDATSGGAGP